MPTDGIEKIERDVISTKHNLVEGRSSLSTVLTQTRIFAKKLGVDHQWITNELEGYSFENLGESREKIPKYRLVTYEFLDMYNRLPRNHPQQTRNHSHSVTVVSQNTIQ